MRIFQRELPLVQKAPQIAHNSIEKYHLSEVEQG